MKLMERLYRVSKSKLVLEFASGSLFVCAPGISDESEWIWVSVSKGTPEGQDLPGHSYHYPLEDNNKQTNKKCETL